MSPTILRERGYRFFFFSREETRIHVHVSCDGGEAKFWLKPVVALAVNHGLNRQQLAEVQSLVEVHAHEFIGAWREHFRG